MIRVLIIDDEPNGIKSAKAGLFPFNSKPDCLDVEYLCDLAEEHYEIEIEDEVTSAVKGIKNFLPDFVIIDVNIKLKKSLAIDDMVLKNGIDLYRYLDKYYPDISKIMFSNHGNDPLYITELTEDESHNFIDKAIGSGYQILASRISKYLKSVSQKLLLKLNHNERSKLLALVNKQDWQVLEHFKIRINDREFQLKSFVLFNSCPILLQKQPALIFKNPKDELIKMLKAYNPNENKNKVRSEWGTESINDLFNFFGTDIEGSKKRVYVKAEYIIASIIDNIIKSPNLRLTTHLDYRLAEHISQRQNHTNANFTDKFYTALSIRLALRFFENFIRENIDTGLKRPGNSFKSFFKEMPNEVLQSVKKRGVAFTKKEMAQEGRNLNIGFKLIDDEREMVETDLYIEYDFETKWLNSLKYNEFINRLMNKI